MRLRGENEKGQKGRKKGQKQKMQHKRVEDRETAGEVRVANYFGTANGFGKAIRDQRTEFR